MKEKVKNRISAFSEYAEGCFIAGGAIRSVVCGEEINDIDIYPKSIKSAVQLLNAVNLDGAAFIHVSDRAVTFLLDGTRYQLSLTGLYQKAEDIFASFDFTNCMAAYDCDSGEVTFAENFVEDCCSRKLRYNTGTLYPYCSMRRVHKFRKRGWNISNSEQFKISHSCPKITSWKQLKEQLGGFYGSKIDIPEDQEFSEEAMYAALDTLRDVEGAEASEPTSVYAALAAAIKAFSFEGFVYNIFSNEVEGHEVSVPACHFDADSIDSLPKVPTLIAIPTGENVYFKAVKSTDDPQVFKSWKKESFTYKLGHTAHDSKYGLFVCKSFKDAVQKARSYDMDTVIAVTADIPVPDYNGELRFKYLTPTGWHIKVPPTNTAFNLNTLASNR